MKDLIDKILTYLPQYLMDFGSAFSGPKSFIAQKHVEGDGAFKDALVFIGVSVVLVVLMNFPLQLDGKDIWTAFAINGLPAEAPKERRLAYPAPQRIRALAHGLPRRSGAKAGCLTTESVDARARCRDAGGGAGA